MKKLVNLLVVLSLLALSQVFQSASVQASTVPISETSYVQITNYTGWYLYINYEDPHGPPKLYEWKGFVPDFSAYYKSTPTIEAKLINSGPGQNGLLFDCHSGYANVGDYASAVPVAFCGMEPWKRIEFDWVSNIIGSASRYLCIELAGPSGTTYEEHVQWRFWPGAGLRSGHAIVDIPYPGITDVVYVRLAVESIPEPGSITALGLGLGCLILRRRKTEKAQKPTIWRRKM